MDGETLVGLLIVVLIVAGWIAQHINDMRETICRECGYDSGFPRSAYPRCPACGRRR